MSNDDEPPEFLLCSISLEIMEDPVIDKEGNTYDRKHIEAWLDENQESPITRAPLQKSDLSPNRSLFDAIEAYKANLAAKAAANHRTPSAPPMIPDEDLLPDLHYDWTCVQLTRLNNGWKYISTPNWINKFELI